MLVARWMRELAEAYGACRAAHPEDRLLFVLDIGGTLLDEQTPVHEPSNGEHWLAAHEPYRGVLDIARWFAGQPMTRVALNSTRPERDRAALRRCLDVLGREYRLDVPDEMLHLRPDGRRGDAIADKREALRRWREQGFRVVAVVDSDSQVVTELAKEPALGRTCFLTTESLLAGRRHTARRDADPVPGHVELVWHGVNDGVRLRQFLASPIRWGEVDLRCGPDGHLLTHHDEIEGAVTEWSEIPTALDVFDRFREAGKALMLDLKDPAALDPALDLAAERGIAPGDLCVNGRVDRVGEQGIKEIAARVPGARLQCPVEFLGPMVVALPEQARTVVRTLQSWGVARFSVAWTNPHADVLLDRLDTWGAEVNLYAVTDLPQFLAAVLRLPASLTADFTLPEWHYFGRGAGNDGEFHLDQREAAIAPGVDKP